MSPQVQSQKGSDHIAENTEPEAHGEPADKLEQLEEGDKILFNDRKQPLKVTAIDLHEFDEGEVYMGSLKGPQGADYHLVQSLKNRNAITVNSMSLTTDGELVRSLQVVQSE